MRVRFHDIGSLRYLRVSTGEYTVAIDNNRAIKFIVSARRRLSFVENVVEVKDKIYTEISRFKEIQTSLAQMRNRNSSIFGAQPVANVATLKGESSV